MSKPCLPYRSSLFSVLVLLVSLVFAAKANAQNCTKEDITFYSQADITNFANANAGCTNITVVGNLIIGYETGTNYSNITDLSPLSKIKTITGSLRIRYNPNLYSLDGLALTNIGGLLYIYGNANLTNINGLSALTSISGFVEIAWNPKLTHLNGLSNLTTMNGSVRVRSNSILTDISGLRNINPAGIGGADGLYIVDNPQLAVCNLPNFCTYLAGSGDRTISGNKTNCLDEAAVTAACASACNALSGTDLILRTQQDVDNFKANYAHCTNISVNNLIIGYDAGSNNSDITNISALSKIKTVTGNIIIRRNPNLTSLIGLDNITSFNGDLRIEKCDALTTISALVPITQARYLNIRDNAELTNLNGLHNLTQITGSGSGSGYLYIFNNAKLANVNALRKLKTIGNYIQIEQNPLLQNLDGLSDVTAINGNIVIRNNAVLDNITGLKNIAASSISGSGSGLTMQDNPNLAVCNLPNFCTYLSGSGNRTISGNKTTCINTAAVTTACNSPVVNITDANFKAYLVGNATINTNGDSEIQVAEAEAFTETIDCSGKNIADLTGIEAFVNLTRLLCQNNQLTTLDVSKNTVLTELYCNDNQLTALDVGKNTALDVLYCYNNQLTWLNLKNGNNSALNIMAASGSPNLTCIQVDNVADANAKPDWYKDAIASYSTDCSNIPDASNILYVNSSVSGGNGIGNDWVNAIRELADALKWAKEQYDTDNTVFDANPLKIFVAQGTYKPLYRADNMDGNNLQDRDNAFVLVKNVQLYGGFAGIETTLEERNYGANPTILSGDIDGISGLSADDVYHVLISAGDVDSALLDGFTVSGGYITSGDGNTSITVNGTPVRYERGAGLSLNNSSLQVRNTVFTDNSAYAGVVSHTNSNATFVNTLFTGNTATYGTIYNTASSPVFVNSTISGNTGATNDNNGTAMRNVAISTPKIYNSIIWGNQTASGSVSNIFNSGGANSSIPEYYHSLVQGVTNTANGNLNTNPMFTDAANGDYRPETGSPVINAGDNTYFEGLNTGSRDLAGYPRLLRHHIDLGAYESDCGGYTLASDAEAGRPLTSGDNYLYSSCSLLAVVRPENATGGIAVSTTSAGDLIGHNGARYVRRYYDLSAENTGDTEVTLFFTQADFDHYNNTFGDAHNASLPEHLRVARYNGAYSVSGTTLSSETKPSFIHNQSVRWNETLGLWEVTFTTPGFSGFFITGQSDDALPVTLSGFTARAGEQSVLLEWHTANEMNTSRYEIQRSNNGRLWQAIGEVAAAGESDAPLAYHYRDLSPLPGLSYYRLRMIDRGDGIYTYSDIRSVVTSKDTDTALLVYPNPATGRIYLDAKEDIAEVLLWDITGRLLKKVRYQEETGISIDGLGSGMLLVEVRLADGTSRTGRVIVQP